MYHSLVRLQEQATEKRDEMAGEVNLEDAVAADEAEAEAAVAAARASTDLRESGTLSASARRASGLEARGSGLPQVSRKSLEHAAKSGKGEVVSAKELVEAAADADEDELVRLPPVSWCLRSTFSVGAAAVPCSCGCECRGCRGCIGGGLYCWALPQGRTRWGISCCPGSWQHGVFQALVLCLRVSDG